MIQDIIYKNEKKYSRDEMVPIGCEDCKGCSKCCHGMEDTIIQDPYDYWMFSSNMRIAGGERVTFDMLISEDGPWELSVHNGLILPNIKMVDDGVCPFLNEEGRCSIHKIRSGLCRLFPLARGYEEDGSISYYLLNEDYGCENHECDFYDVKITEWLGIDNIEEYEKYQYSWHTLKKKMEEKLKGMSIEEAGTLQSLFLAHFYSYNYGRDFYSSYYEREAEFIARV